MKQYTLKQQLASDLIFILHADKRIFCRDDRKTPKTIFSATLGCHYLPVPCQGADGERTFS